MSHPWTGHQQIGRVKRPQPATALVSETADGHCIHCGKPLTPSTKASHKDVCMWWLNPATFYREARERFPEAGAAVSDRSKVYTRGAEFVRPSKQRGAL